MKLYKCPEILIVVVALLTGCGSAQNVEKVETVEAEKAIQFAPTEHVQNIASMFSDVKEADWEYIDDVLIPDHAHDRIGAVLFWDRSSETSNVAFFDENGFFQQCGVRAKTAENPNFTYLGNGTVTFDLEKDEGRIYSYKLTLSIEGSNVSFKVEEELTADGDEEGAETDIGNLDEAKPIALDLLLESDNPVLDFLGADGVELNYVDEMRLVFHSFAGLFVCERDSEGWKLVSSVDLKPLGADMTQGDEASLILAQKDQILIMPKRYAENQENSITYRYQYLERELELVEGFPELEDPALSWSYSREGMEISEKIYEAMGQGEWFISNPYPIRESDSRQYGFIAVGPDGFASLQFGRYFEKSDKVTLEPIEFRTYLNQIIDSGR